MSPSPEVFIILLRENLDRDLAKGPKSPRLMVQENEEDRRNRPVYVCVRSYQAWLEPVLADMGAQGAARQAVMVKHLAHLVKDPQAVTAVPAGVRIQPSRVSKTDAKKL